MTAPAAWVLLEGMSAWVTGSLLVASLVFLGALWVLWLGRRSGAGLHVGATARTARLTGFVGRSVARRLWLKLRGLVATRRRRRELAHRHAVQTAEEAAALMGNMKGVAMKVGQIVSFASGSLPDEAQRALRTLQRDAPPMAFSVVREVLETELGQDLGARFAHVDERPLAAASIGQVHRARLRDGTRVVLKVQYPGVAESIANDLKFAKGMAALIQSFHKNADAPAMVAELRERLLDEVDYRKEAANQMLFRRLWEGHPLIRVPRVYPQHSTGRVLCQEYVRGLGFYDFVEAATPREKAVAVRVLNDFVFDSMHRFMAFNGDPHPGNYLFQPDGGVTFLDFGIVKYFDEAFMDRVQALNRAIVEEDHAAFEASVRALGIVLPDRPYDHDFLWEFFRYHAAPFAEDRVFTFTPAWVRQAGEVMSPGNLRRLNLPPDLIFFNRITFGLNAIFSELGASGNWHQQYRRYLYDPSLPPSLAEVGVELPARFLDGARAPARPQQVSETGPSDRAGAAA